MDTCSPKILIKKDNFYIAQCENCKRIGLTYKNILAGFYRKEFQNFANTLQSINFENNSILFPDGEPHIIVKTCHKDIQFAFSKEEFHDLIDGLAEANLILEVEKILGEI